MIHVFDMDGVILDSNGLKTEAFRRAALRYGEQAADWLVGFHQQAGSITRRERVERFFEWVGTPPGSELMAEADPDEVDAMLAQIAAELAGGYKSCAVVPGVVEYIESLRAPCYVVSGVEQGELRDILRERGLDRLFAGIFGGNKHQAIPALVGDGTLTLPATYYGDTLDDYEAATAAGLEFVFVYRYSEWGGWGDFFAGHEARVIRDFNDLNSYQPYRARVGSDGFALVRGERFFAGRSLAGAEVTFA